MKEEDFISSVYSVSSVVHELTTTKHTEYTEENAKRNACRASV